MNMERCRDCDHLHYGKPHIFKEIHGYAILTDDYSCDKVDMPFDDITSCPQDWIDYADHIRDEKIERRLVFKEEDCHKL